MDFTEVVTKRRMVRNFSDEPISNDEVDRILNLARRGPSAGFSQGQDFIVVNDKAKRLEIAALCEAIECAPLSASPKKRS